MSSTASVADEPGHTSVVPSLSLPPYIIPGHPFCIVDSVRLNVSLYIPSVACTSVPLTELHEHNACQAPRNIPIIVVGKPRTKRELKTEQDRDNVTSIFYVLTRTFFIVQITICRASFPGFPSWERG